MDSSLFGKIARRPLRTGRNDAEDRLTEVLAAVIGQAECDGLAKFVVRGWLAAAVVDDRLSNRAELAALMDDLASGSWAPRVSTQVFVTASGRQRRPDLEIVFESAERQEIVIWVELKHGTPPSRRQLSDYLLAQKERGHLGAVLLVAPRADYSWFDAAEMPETVPRLNWQNTAALLGRYEAPTETGGFLVGELQHYLREERLMDPPRITPEHLVAFAHHKEAFQALDLVCELADAAVARAWAPPEPDQGGSHYGGQYWWLYPSGRPGEPQIEDWTFDWDLFKDSSAIFRDGRWGIARFVAGASADAGVLGAIDADTGDRLRRSGFDLLPKTALIANGYDRIWRCRCPDEVLAGASLEAQGESLAAWVVRTFELLREILVR